MNFLLYFQATWYRLNIFLGREPKFAMNCWSQHQGYELTAGGSGCKTATVTDDGYRIESDTPKSAGGGGIERVAQNKGEYFFRFLELWGPLYEA